MCKISRKVVGNPKLMLSLENSILVSIPVTYRMKAKSVQVNLDPVLMTMKGESSASFNYAGSILWRSRIQSKRIRRTLVLIGKGMPRPSQGPVIFLIIRKRTENWNIYIYFS